MSEKKLDPAATNEGAPSPSERSSIPPVIQKALDECAKPSEKLEAAPERRNEPSSTADAPPSPARDAHSRSPSPDRSASPSDESLPPEEDDQDQNLTPEEEEQPPPLAHAPRPSHHARAEGTSSGRVEAASYAPRRAAQPAAPAERRPQTMVAYRGGNLPERKFYCHRLVDSLVMGRRLADKLREIAGDDAVCAVRRAVDEELYPRSNKAAIAQELASGQATPQREADLIRQLCAVVNRGGEHAKYDRMRDAPYAYRSIFAKDWTLPHSVRGETPTQATAPQPAAAQPAPPTAPRRTTDDHTPPPRSGSGEARHAGLDPHERRSRDPKRPSRPPKGNEPK